jgi:hypothetical protein
MVGGFHWDGSIAGRSNSLLCDEGGLVGGEPDNPWNQKLTVHIVSDNAHKHSEELRGPFSAAAASKRSDMLIL